MDNLTRDQYGLALDRIRPGAAYTRYDTYAAIVETWTDAIQTVPSQAELETAWAAYDAEQTALAAQQAAEAIVQADAYTGALNIPDWATWTDQQFLDWYADNLSDTQVDLITDLPKARNYLKKLSKAVHHVILLAMYERNHIWPSIQD